jgi:hypothetical protein
MFLSPYAKGGCWCLGGGGSPSTAASRLVFVVWAVARVRSARSLIEVRATLSSVNRLSGGICISISKASRHGIDAGLDDLLALEGALPE